MLSAILLPTGERGLYLDYPSVDEAVWQVKAENWLHSEDNKSPPFLLIYHLLGIDKTYFYTRLLNAVLVLFSAYLIYSMTNKIESFLFILLPLYTDAFVLYDTTFEVLFILLAIKYEKHAGIYTGLAMIMRPYAIIYTILLKNRQKTVLIGVGIIWAAFLLLTGSFWNYLGIASRYAADTPNVGNYWTWGGVFLLGVFGVLGWQKDKRVFWYGVVACIPLILRAWGHYFLPAITLFFFELFIRGKMYNFVH